MSGPHVSFIMTKGAVRRREKTVTRRLRAERVTPGGLFVPVAQAQGLKRGEKHVSLWPQCRWVSKRAENLEDLLDPDKYSYVEAKREMVREGFPDMEPAEFVEMFRRANHKLTGPYPLPLFRLELEYLCRLCLKEKATRDGYCDACFRGASDGYDRSSDGCTS